MSEQTETSEETSENARREAAAEESSGGRRPNYLVPDIEPFPIDSDDPIIELEDVHKSFEEDEVLKGLSMSVQAGEITVIIGASASGKSVLIKHMNGLHRPDSGEVYLFGEPVSEMSDSQLDRSRKRIGTLFQNYALFDSMTVLENVSFPLTENNAMAVSEAEEMSRERLEELGLGHALDQYPATLSGGMKKRVSLARALVTNPEVVLFDEPTTGLDPIMMEFVDEMIEKATEEFQLTSIIISHDMASTFRLADSIAVLHGGQIIAHDDPQTIRESDDERVQDLVRGARKDAIDKDRAASEDVTADSEFAVVVDNITKAFGDTVVLDGASMKVPYNEVSVLIGGSGEGKSVMMKHLLGLMIPDDGSVEVLGRNVVDLSERELRELRTEIGMLFQHAALFDSMTVADNVAFPLVERQIASRSEAAQRVEEMLERLDITETADRNPTEISSGQQKRASLARALITEPKLIIYDEPTTGQDPMMTQQVEEMIQEVQDNFDVTSLIISHDMALTFRLGDHVAMLSKGKVIAEGPPRSLLESDNEKVKEFIYASQVAQAGRDEEEAAQ